MNTDSAQRQTARWIEILARCGYAAKGLVYCLVGILAFQAAFNWGGKVSGSKGALAMIAEQPFGKILLFIVGIGLVGYVIWRFVQAIYDPEHNKNGWKNYGRRFSYFISGLIYGSLAFATFRIVFGGSSSDSSGGSQQKTASLLSLPFGQWLVGLIGFATAGYGFYSIYKGVTTKFRKKLKTSQMSSTQEAWVTRIGRFGLICKGIVATIIGYFFVQAFRLADPSQAKTTEGVLKALEQQPFGAYLMGVVALGLIAYGIHLFVQARYRRISPG